MPEIVDQLALEEQGRQEAMEDAKRCLNQQQEDTPLSSGIVEHLIVHVVEQLTASLEEMTKKRGVKPMYYRIIKKLSADQDGFFEMAAAVTLRSITNEILMGHRTGLSNLAWAVGYQLIEEIKYNNFVAQDKKREVRYSKGLKQRNRDVYRQQFMRRAYESNDYVFTGFSQEEKESLGTYLVVLVVNSTDMFEIQAGDTQEVRPTAIFEKTIELNKAAIIERAIKYLPMIVPPKPWSSLYDGGYYGRMRVSNLMIRYPQYLKNTHRLRNYIARLNELDLSEITDAVNKIQATPYYIRKDILDVEEALFKESSGTAGLPLAEPLEPIPRLIGDDIPPEKLKEHKKKIVAHIHMENSRQGQALRCVSILSIARRFAGYDKIWFPCNIDFRGRVYPIPTGLNFQGDDLVKGLLGYAEPVPCSDIKDIDLLAIAGAGFAGIDKVSYKESIDWILEHEDQIKDSAASPLEYRWWAEQDEPFQFLHFCKEWVRAKEYIVTEGSIIGFESDLKIPFDGTCSGLQHYSCMLRDEIGGSSVNLIDHERPADIYREVSDKITPWITSDMRVVDKDKQMFAIAWMAQGINRKVVKRCVMTLAYGSAQYGFGDQLFEDWTKNNPIFKDIEFKAAQYLAKYIYKAVGETVVKAMEGMTYLKYLAGLLAAKGYAVEWVTPLGLPIQQVYLKSSMKVVRLAIGNQRYRLYTRKLSKKEVIHKTKQVSGVAPNFIHSLDATHLFLVVNNSNLSNYTTIHDSFGTSLGEARSLTHTIREQLVYLYTKYTPLQDFREHVEELTKEPVEVDPPEMGKLDINSVITSRFVFH